MKKESIVDKYIKRSDYDKMTKEEKENIKKEVLSDDTFFYGLQIEELIKSINGLSSVMRDK